MLFDGYVTRVSEASRFSGGMMFSTGSLLMKMKDEQILRQKVFVISRWEGVEPFRALVPQGIVRYRNIFSS